VNLFLSPHLDDIFIGTYSNKELYNDGVYIGTTNNVQPHQKEDMTYKKLLVKDIKRIKKQMNFGNVFFFDIYDTKSFEYLDSLYSKIVKLIKKYKPNKIFIPSLEGGNIDHDALSILFYFLKDNKNLILKDIIVVEYALYYKENDEYIHNKFRYNKGDQMKKLHKNVLKEKRAFLNKLTSMQDNVKFFLNDCYESIREYVIPDVQYIQELRLNVDYSTTDIDFNKLYEKGRKYYEANYS
jgi:hypothetical protein